MAKVSVIIPTHNREDYISDTLESVINQTYKDLEIIVIDDGSTDNTKKKLETFGNKIKLIEQKNSERAVARNNGVKSSSGKYIAFLDSDDIWIKHKLEKQVKALDEDQDVVLVCGQSLRVNDLNKKIKPAKRQSQGYSGNVFEKLLLRNFVVSATPIIKREHFEKTSGFETKYVPYEDWEFWLRLSLLGKFHFLPAPLSFYRIHKEQSVKLTKAEKIEEVTLSVLRDSFRLKNISNDLQRHSLGLANLRFCYWYLLANQEEKAKEKIKKAQELYPAFLLDPRWHGLNILCNFPQLRGKGIFELRQYH